MSTLAEDYRHTSDRPSSDIISRIHRRHSIVTANGLDGAMAVAAMLQSCGYPIRDFAVDVREGIVYSSLSCTISMTAAEACGFADRLGALPSVVSVDPF